MTSCSRLQQQQHAKFRWTEKLTCRFIQLRRDHAKLFTGRKYSAQQGWEYILKEMRDEFPAIMADVHYRVLKKKWSNLLQQYKELKHPVHGDKNRADDISWPFYSAIDEVIASLSLSSDNNSRRRRRRRRVGANCINDEEHHDNEDLNPQEFLCVSVQSPDDRETTVDCERIPPPVSSLVTSASNGQSTSAKATAAAAMKVEAPPKELFKPLQLPQRILTGPGPSNCSPRVLRALQQQVLGHMHPEIFQLMDEIKAGLRYAFQTTNKLTLALSASGHAGFEAAVGNVLERGEKILIVKGGIWGDRAADMANRLGMQVEFVVTEPGVALSLAELEEAVKKHQPTAVFVAHSESSTGLKQPLEGIGDIVHEYGGLLIVDAVASLGAEPLFADAWGIDVVYTGSQKVLGAPPGITPITFSPKAEHKILNRKSPIPVFYFDVTWLGRYWDCFENQGPRPYHHSLSATLVYGLRESLAQLAEEGLVNCWTRHQAVADKFHEGLIKRGYEFFVKEPRHRLKTVSAIRLPEGVEAPAVIRYAMERYNVEISGGLGPSVGKVLRVGLMGMNATPGHVDLVLRALDEAVKHVKGNLRSHI